MFEWADGNRVPHVVSVNASSSNCARKTHTVGIQRPSSRYRYVVPYAIQRRKTLHKYDCYIIIIFCNCNCNWSIYIALPTKRPEAHYRVIYIYSAKAQLNTTVLRQRLKDVVLTIFIELVWKTLQFSENSFQAVSRTAKSSQIQCNTPHNTYCKNYQVTITDNCNDQIYVWRRKVQYQNIRSNSIHIVHIDSMHNQLTNWDMEIPEQDS